MAGTVTTEEQGAPSPASVPPAPTGPFGHPVWWAVAAVAGGLLIVGAVLLRPDAPAAGDSASPMAVTEQSITVDDKAPQWSFLKLAAVGQVGSHWTDTVPARISIDESRSSRVGVPLEGRVTRVLAELGDRVSEGQPLLAIASPAVDELRAAREQATVELEAARTALARVEATVASRAVPAKEAESARQRVSSAEVALRLAEGKLASVRANANERELLIRAPRAGVVVEKTVVVNQEVEPDGPSLMVVADLSSVWAIADVFESRAIDIEPGIAAQVTTPSVPGATMTGTVLMVSSIGDPERHTLPVRIRLDNADHRLRPNVYARVRFYVQQPDASVEVAASAVVSDGQHQYVYVQDRPGHFTRREVVAGSAHEGRIPIVSGLSPGETVVEEGAILLDNQIAISQ